jgi:hypothetical protein
MSMRQLEPDEIADLGDFLARRLPSPSPEGWGVHIAETQVNGTLAAVLADAARRCDDPRLREVRALLTEPARGGRPWLLAASVACALTLLAVVGTGTGVALASLQPPPPPPVVAVRIEPPVVAPVAPVEPVVAAPAPRLADHPCARAGDGVVGWWYAGNHAPGAAGEVIQLPRDANVRASAPGKDNRYNAHTKVRCVLKQGDRVRLSADATRIPPGVYWVPLRAEDVQPTD